MILCLCRGKKCSCSWFMHDQEVFRGEISRCLYATFRRFGERDVLAYIYPHRDMSVCLHTRTHTETELFGKLKCSKST